jgi:3-hydroxyisobutyrate dehydrogenase/glyoxylate/succinic semialdehyde reductase
MKIGFIGLGIMGSRMAANLQKHGFDLVVHNRTRGHADPLVEKGAVWADSPAAVARQVDVLFSMLTTPEVVEATALGTDGFLEPLKAGAIWADCSTVNPSFSRRMAKAAQQAGVHFLDAPVAGTKAPAENAQLLFLVGGEAADVDACRPYFEAMGRQAIHAGPTGAGTSLKMVFNVLLGMSMLAFSEALVLGESLGLDRNLLFDSLQGSVVVSPSATSKRAKIEAGDYEADFPLQWLQKDLQLATLSAYEQGVSMPATNAAKETYMLAERYGHAKEDMSAIYPFLKDQISQRG